MGLKRDDARWSTAHPFARLNDEGASCSCELQPPLLLPPHGALAIAGERAVALHIT